MLNIFDIRYDNPCPSDRELFFASYTNKENFISELAAKLEIAGVKVIMCPSDADTTIVISALQIEDDNVLVLTDDTDILCLLIHHVSLTISMIFILKI
jgi:hypothetical protein